MTDNLTEDVNEREDIITMNLKRWLYNLRHLNLMENNFAEKIANIDAEQKNLSNNLNLALSFIQENNNLKEEVFNLKNMIYNLKSDLKKNSVLPIRVVFLCEMQALFKAFSSLIDLLSKDKRFEIIIVNCWYKDYATDGSYHYINPHIEKICKNKQVRFIDSYDSKRDIWINLEKLHPDYIFFNRPYEHYRNESYHIKNISKYSKTCYIPYGIRIIGGEIEKVTNPTDFCSQLHFFFLSNSLERESINNILPDLDNDHLLYLGYPGFDCLRNELNNSDFYKSDNFNILWLPRWTTSEGNCSFFDYKDVLLQYAKDHKDSYLIFRPHPICFSSFIKTGTMSSEELKDFKNNFPNKNIAEIDESGNYTTSFLKSDVLVADETSLLAEYFATGKPIIFCKKTTHFSTLMEVLVEGMYVVSNKNELIATLNSLKSGYDPLKVKRDQIIDKYLFDYGESVAENIKNALISDI